MIKLLFKNTINVKYLSNQYFPQDNSHFMRTNKKWISMNPNMIVCVSEF